MRDRLQALIVLVLAAAAPASAQTQAPAAKPFTPTITVGGYVQAELDAGQQGDSRFPDSNRIFLRRARITASGKVLPDLQYKLQGDFAGGLGAASSIKPSMTDGYIEWTKYRAAHVRVGQFKAGFGEEWLTPSTQLITVERTLASDRLTLNRQIGLQLSGDLANTRLSYAAALFNGNGRNTTVNDDGKFLYTARGSAVVWRGHESGSLRLGAAGFWNTATQLSEPGDFGLDSTPETPDADHLLTGSNRGVNLNAQWLEGIWRVDTEWFHDRFIQDNGVPQSDVVGRGWYVMPAAFVYQRSLLAVGRYEEFIPNTDRDDEKTREWLAGIDYYLRGANKITIDYLWVGGPAHPDEHNKLLAQLQVVF
jgi:phosphate-selective porin